MDNQCYLGEIPMRDGRWGYVCMVCKALYILPERDLEAVKTEMPYLCPDNKHCHKLWENGDYPCLSGEEYFDLVMKHFGENNLVVDEKRITIS